PEADVIALFQQIEASRHPTIAMVHGAAYAGGGELALHCGFRVAADVARFAMPLARIGLVVPFALGQKLVEIIGPAFTRQILLTGQPVDAGRAYEMGMVHAVVPAADLERATYDLAKTIADNAPLSLAGMKSTIRRALSLRERVEHKALDEIARRERGRGSERAGVHEVAHPRRDLILLAGARSPAAVDMRQRQEMAELVGHHPGRRAQIRAVGDQANLGLLSRLPTELRPRYLVDQ